MSRTRLEIYDDYPADAIDRAITQWIKNRQHREILHYKLVDGLTYREIADILSQETGRIFDEKSIQRAVYKAESKLFPNLEIVYRKN